MSEHENDFIALSIDGASWRMVYAFDSPNWPQAGFSGYNVADGMIAVAYTASAVPAVLTPSAVVAFSGSGPTSATRGQLRFR